jgi:hypothetical protein
MNKGELVELGKSDTAVCAANGARAAERAGFRQEECGDIHRAGKSGLSVCRCPPKFVKQIGEPLVTYAVA